MTFNLPSTDIDQGLTQRLSEHLVSVETRLAEAVTNTDALADTASRHLVQAGGKRVRPLLTLLAAELGDGVNGQVIDAAVIVELIHLAPLFHAAVMDSAPTRRGAPAAHLVWGNSVAILTGDLLFARASQMASELGPEAVRILAEAFERLCMGQLHETVGPGPQDDPVQHYLRVLADKTGSLVATTGRFGTFLSGCDQPTIEMLTEFGERVGVAFQLADDVIDLSDQVEVTGKVAGTDLREGVATMPVLLLREAAGAGDADAAALLARIDGDLSDDAVLAEVVADLRAHPVTEATQARAHAWSREAIALIAELPEGPVTQALVSFAEGVVDRAS